MKAKIGILKVVLAGALALASATAQADIIKNAVRVGGFELAYARNYVPLTTSGDPVVFFTGTGKFTVWYTAECAASGYVDVDISVDGIWLAPTGDNINDFFCDPDTRGGMHTVTARTPSLVAGTHLVRIIARKTDGLAFLSDSSLLIGN